MQAMVITRNISRSRSRQRSIKRFVFFEKWGDTGLVSSFVDLDNWIPIQLVNFPQTVQPTVLYMETLVRQCEHPRKVANLIGITAPENNFNALKAW